MRGGVRTICFLAAAIVLAALLASCGDGDANESTPTSTTTPTGIADVDRLIAAIDTQDDAALLEHLTFAQERCSTSPRFDPETLYQPPQCPEGTDDGTRVDVLISGNCEIGPVLAGAAETEIRARLVDRPQRVYAVVGPSAIARWAFDYVLIYATPGAPEGHFSGVVGISDGGVAAVATWCGPVSEAAVSLTEARGAVLYLAPGYSLATPEPTVAAVPTDSNS